MELTVELSQNKWPPEEQLPALFKANLPAMLAFPLAAAFSGLRWASFPSSLLPFPVACYCVTGGSGLLMYHCLSIVKLICLPCGSFQWQGDTPELLHRSATIMAIMG